MTTVDDLLSQRRRGALSDADERRVQIAVQTSREHQLAFLAGDVFEREGAPQAGDAALVQRIVRRVESQCSGTFRRVLLPRRLSRWVSLPLLLAGSAAASFGGYRALQTLAPAAAPVQVVGRVQVAGPVQRGHAVQAAGQAEVAAPEVQAAPAAAALGVEPRVVAHAASESTAPRHPPKPRPASPGAASPVTPNPRGDAREAVDGALAAAPAPELYESARALFRHANQLRQTDWLAAASLYEQLTLRFASSAEAGVAQMALGKHALDEGRASEALRWFRAYQLRAGGELAAEALWGEARALENIGERAHAHDVWRRLIERYPASAYAAAAREQLGP